MRRFTTIACLILTLQSNGQDWSKRVAETAMNTWKDSFMLAGDKVPKWRYDQGVILKGIEGIWNATGDPKYFNYIQKSMDYYVKEDGSIKGYRKDEFNIDHVNNGKLLLLLYRVTGKEKYKKAADHLRQQLREHPRTSGGGFWHKKIYPYQMWLDGLYMGQPFYAEYAMLFHDDTAFNDIARQFILMERHARDPKSGLLFHGWDESRTERWADKNTGLSQNFWGRALGWYGMAMVDALDHFPLNHTGRDSIIGILNRFAKAVTMVQDGKTGLWYDVVDKSGESKNYFEASASSMLVYTLAKGVRKGYLPASYLANARKGYAGIVRQFIKTESGQTNLHGTVAVSGLGGNPYRDGSFDYYMKEPVVVNDPKGVGAFIKAAVEMEMIPKLAVGKGKTVLLDYYFNNEWKKDATGTDIRWHYTWDDKSNGGFSMLGDIFSTYGVKKTSLEKAPTKASLKGADIYVIVDPDTQNETARPNYIQPADILAVSNWVKAGGVLVLLGNDSANAEFEHFNNLASKFSVTFQWNSRNRVEANRFEQGAIMVPANHTIFKTAGKLFIKELSSIRTVGKSKPAIVLKNGNDNVMAVTKYGKGTVFMLGDPWLYNEYVDGRKLPAEYENYNAAVDLVQWLIKQVPKKK
ncbi:MAG: glucuronyl hydrolase [Chitinophagaceae bacterium]|nr:glucuronyl hydrolase [Chitinophagaceae bacterium]